MWVAFANAKATHIFSAKILAYAIFNDQSFTDMVTNDIVSFEQLGPDFFNYFSKVVCFFFIVLITLAK